LQYSTSKLQRNAAFGKISFLGLEFSRFMGYNVRCPQRILSAWRVASTNPLRTGDATAVARRGRLSISLSLHKGEGGGDDYSEHAQPPDPSPLSCPLAKGRGEIGSQTLSVTAPRFVDYSWTNGASLAGYLGATADAKLMMLRFSGNSRWRGWGLALRPLPQSPVMPGAASNAGMSICPEKEKVWMRKGSPWEAGGDGRFITWK